MKLFSSRYFLIILFSLLLVVSITLTGCGPASSMRLGRDSAAKGDYFIDADVTDEYIVFISSKDNNLYRCNLDGTNVVRLVDGVCTNVYCVDNVIYYFGYADKYSDEHDTSPTGHYPNGLFRVNPDGSFAAWVAGDFRGNGVFSNEDVYFMNIWDSDIYVYSLRDLNPISGDIIVKTSENEINIPLAASNDFLVYSSYISGDSRDKTRIIKADRYGNKSVIASGDMDRVSIYDNKIYYTGIDGNLFCMTLDGQKSERIINHAVFDYIIEDDVIYYVDHTSGHICKAALDGGKVEQVVKSICYDVKIANNVLYYLNNNQDAIYACYPNGEKRKVLQAVFSIEGDLTGYPVYGI